MAILPLLPTAVPCHVAFVPRLFQPCTDARPPAARTASRYAVTTAAGRLRLVAHAEGVSLLLLVFVGVPLKHLLGVPAAVRVLGPGHGALFVLYLVLLIETRFGSAGASWSRARTAAAFAAALVPFGTFFLLGPLLDESGASADRPAASA